MKYSLQNIVKQGLFLTFAIAIGNFLNLVFNFYLGRMLNPADFALIALFVSILYAVNVFFSALAFTSNHAVGVSSVPARKESSVYISRVWRKGVFTVGFFVSLVWLLASPFLATLWKVETISLIFFLPIFIFGALAFLNRGILQGNFKFFDSGMIFLAESGAKLLIALIFVFVGIAHLAYLSISISIFVGYLISLWFMHRLSLKKITPPQIQKSVAVSFPSQFFFFSLLLGLSTLTFLSIDVILAKTFFSPEEAGAYALITLGGKMLFFLSSLLGVLLISLVSHAEGEKRDTKNIFRVFFGISFCFVAVGATFFMFFGEHFFLFFFEQKVVTALSFLPLYIIAISAFSLSNMIVLYHHAKREFVFPIISSISSVFLIAGALVFHATLEQFIEVLFVVAIIDFVAISFLHLLRGHAPTVQVPKKQDATQILPLMSEKVFGKGNLTTVTIGIPAYNEQFNIGNLLKQILLQEHKGFIVEKIIVISDGSTDNTVKVAQEYESKGITVIPRKENRGLNYTQNEIIQNTTSDILVLLNADIFLGNNEVIFNLVVPVINGTADLSATWAKPLPPQTFMEHILCAGFDLKYFIYTHYKNGNNIYTCVGHMRAISKKFYKKVTFPTVSSGEDQYLYLTCTTNGYRYRHAVGAHAYFKLPDTWNDYKKYAVRIFQTQKKYEDVFKKQLVRRERSIPFFLKVRGGMYGIRKHPVYAPIYLILHVMMYFWTKTQTKNSSSTWEIPMSTKKLLK